MTHTRLIRNKILGFDAFLKPNIVRLNEDPANPMEPGIGTWLTYKNHDKRDEPSIYHYRECLMSPNYINHILGTNFLRTWEPPTDSPVRRFIFENCYLDATLDSGKVGYKLGPFPLQYLPNHQPATRSYKRPVTPEFEITGCNFIFKTDVATGHYPIFMSKQLTKTGLHTFVISGCRTFRSFEQAKKWWSPSNTIYWTIPQEQWGEERLSDLNNAHWKLKREYGTCVQYWGAKK